MSDMFTWLLGRGLISTFLETSDVSVASTAAIFSGADTRYYRPLKNKLRIFLNLLAILPHKIGFRTKEAYSSYRVINMTLFYGNQTNPMWTTHCRVGEKSDEISAHKTSFSPL